MGIPKKKNMINVYGGKDTYYGEGILKRREEFIYYITRRIYFRIKVLYR